MNECNDMLGVDKSLFMTTVYSKNYKLSYVQKQWMFITEFGRKT
jgi:hypothetical protein